MTDQPITTEAEAAQAAVAAGIAVLDTWFGEPGNAEPDGSWAAWRDRINRSLLSVSSVFQCPLGQVFDTYNDGIDALGDAGLIDFDEADDDDEATELFAVAHGFDQGLFEDRIYVGYDVLTAAWLRALPPAEPATTTT
jgi:hypothetical protein